MFFAGLAGAMWLTLFVIDVVLIIAAFRSSSALGILTIFLPFYAVTTGNHRLATKKRAQLAVAWWACFALAIVFAMSSARS